MGKAGKRKKKYWILGFLLAVSMGMGCAGAESSKDARRMAKRKGWGAGQRKAAKRKRTETGMAERRCLGMPLHIWTVRTACICGRRGVKSRFC